MTMGFYSAIKKNEFFFAEKWIELENIILNKVCKVQKDKVLMFALICGRQTPYKYEQYHTYI
jgi:hypothetical protein